MGTVSYSITNDTVMVVWEGTPHIVRKGSPNFDYLRSALINEDWSSVEQNLTIKKSLADWARGAFTVDGDVVSYNGRAIPSSLNRRIVDMATRGESPEAFFNFWERLQRNPSNRSVGQLWDFLNHLGIPLTPDGCFMAYKGVNQDLTDRHTGKVDNTPGVTNVMERNLVSDDPDTGCHFGFHVGALEYAQGFGARVVICKVDPEHVVCVPKDSSFQKMRVCQYTVDGFFGGQLPSTTLDERDLGEDEFGDEDEDEVLAEDTDSETLPLPEVLTAEEPAQPKPEIKVKKAFAKLHAMSARDLLDQPIARLRRYACKGLKITGATKIPGGRTSLVLRISAVRGY